MVDGKETVTQQPVIGIARNVRLGEMFEASQRARDEEAESEAERIVGDDGGAPAAFSGRTRIVVWRWPATRSDHVNGTILGGSACHSVRVLTAARP